MDGETAGFPTCTLTQPAQLLPLRQEGSTLPSGDRPGAREPSVRACARRLVTAAGDPLLSWPVPRLGAPSSDTKGSPGRRPVERSPTRKCMARQADREVGGQR